MDFLQRIVDRKAIEVERRRRHYCYRNGIRKDDIVWFLREKWQSCHVSALSLCAGKQGVPGVFAEIKYRSPSAGQIRVRQAGGLDDIAQGYAANGASAISVLCDGPGFGGSVLDLRRARRTVADKKLPLLFKEFVLDALQVESARLSGASMVLLLVCALETHRLRTLIEDVCLAGMTPLVEVASAEEFASVEDLNLSLIGINSRNLRSFEVDPQRADVLVQSIAKAWPKTRTVFMSGIQTHQDLRRVGDMGADFALVGESLMRQPDPGAALRALLEGPIQEA